MFDKSMIYLIMAVFAGISFLLLVPKEQYKRYLLYGLLFGGLGDTIVGTVLSSLNLIQYKNMGFFNIFNIFSFWTPITWTFAFGIFFYLLPVRKVFLVPYLLTFVGLNYTVGLVMQSFGLFEYIGVQKYFAPLTFLLWYIVSSWIFLKNEHIILN